MGDAGHLFLDHNAGTVVDPRVLARFAEVEAACPGNPASVHGPGRRARAALESARAQVATALPGDFDVVFCSGGTEANNCAVSGSGDGSLPVLLAAVEHPSVREPAQRRGIVEWATDREGRAVVAQPERPVGLVCLVHAQSEVGAIQPVVAAAELAAKMQVPLHVDAAQTLGRLSLDDVLRTAASVSLSPHKAGGLRGVGVLLVRRGADVRPSVLGGGQESGRRAGTVSPSLAAAAALAIELAVREQPERARRMLAAVQGFERVLSESIARWRRISPLPRSLPNTLMLQVEDVDGRNLLPALDLDGVAASHGSACSSGSPQPPSVLAAMGLSERAARACVRFSFGADADAHVGERAGQRVAAVFARMQEKN